MGTTIRRLKLNAHTTLLLVQYTACEIFEKIRNRNGVQLIL